MCEYLKRSRSYWHVLASHFADGEMAVVSYRQGRWYRHGLYSVVNGVHEITHSPDGEVVPASVRQGPGIVTV